MTERVVSCICQLSRHGERLLRCAEFGYLIELGMPLGNNTDLNFSLRYLGPGLTTMDPTGHRFQHNN